MFKKFIEKKVEAAVGKAIHDLMSKVLMTSVEKLDLQSGNVIIHPGAIVVNAAPGMNAAQVAELVIEKLRRKIKVSQAQTIDSI